MSTPMRLVLALLLLALAAPPTVAQEAPNAVSAGALPLTSEQPSAADTLWGSSAGAFRYYRFEYPGGFLPITLTLTFAPGLATVGADRFGLNLYGPAGLAGRGAATSDTRVELTLRTGASGEYLVQVFNYAAGQAVQFTLSVAGLMAPAPAVENDAPERAIALEPPAGVVSGQLVGQATGAFHYFTLAYPGGGQALTITLTYPVAAGVPSGAVGFNLYRGARLIAQGVETSRSASDVTVSATVRSPAASVFTLQVGNYAAGRTVPYWLAVSGLAARPAAVRGGATPAEAVTLVPTGGAAASLVGSRAGAFHFYRVAYGGGNAPLTIVLTLERTGGAPANALGFDLYADGTLVGQAPAADDGTGLLVATWTYVAGGAATLTIQVVNYWEGARADYTIYAIAG